MGLTQQAVGQADGLRGHGGAVPNHVRGHHDGLTHVGRHHAAGAALVGEPSIRHIVSARSCFPALCICNVWPQVCTPTCTCVCLMHSHVFCMTSCINVTPPAVPPTLTWLPQRLMLKWWKYLRPLEVKLGPLVKAVLADRAEKS